MCGIAGFMSLGPGPGAGAEGLTAMTDTLAHRGPDGGGQTHRDGVSLGFRRLGVIAPGGGDHPLEGPDGNVALVCNGEIYNEPELRAELSARGHRFTTPYDTEVIIHLYEEMGTDLLSRLRGQFAFALHDRGRGRLFLARDQIGVLPLHHTLTPDAFVFGSEAKAILAFPGVERAVDLVGLDQVLTFPGLVSPRTMFKGVETLPGGHYLLVENGKVERRRYWDLHRPDPHAPEKSEVEYTERLLELLDRSVRRRLRADVPVGLYLSGGLDSSLIAALAERASPGHPTFSVAFPGTDIDESGYQRLVADRLSSVHHETRMGSSEIVDHLYAMVLHAETPVKESYNVCSLALADSAREADVRVVLSGEGADELFGGYVGYRLDGLGPGAPSRGSLLEEALERKVRTRLWGDPDVGYERSYHTWRRSKAPLYSEAVRASFGQVDCLRHPVVDNGALSGLDPLSRRSYLDLRLRLADHLLGDHGDRMAMARSVETRHPFLDLDVVEFAATVPPKLKVNASGEKYLVRRAAERLVPEAILGREKFGFRAPGSPSVLRAGAEWVADVLSPALIARQGYFDPTVVERLRQRSLSPDADLHPHYEDDLLFVVLTFGILLDLFGLPDLN